MEKGLDFAADESYFSTLISISIEGKIFTSLIIARGFLTQKTGSIPVLIMIPITQTTVAVDRLRFEFLAKF